MARKSSREAQKRVQKKREKRAAGRKSGARPQRGAAPAAEGRTASPAAAAAEPAGARSPVAEVAEVAPPPTEPDALEPVEELTLQAELDLREGRPEAAAEHAAAGLAALDQEEGLDASQGRHLRNRLGAVQHGRVLEPLGLDLAQVARAMHSGSHGRRSWVDPVTATVVDRGPWPGKELKGPGDRFQIPPLDPHEARGLRSLFVSRLEAGDVREHLEETLADGSRFEERVARDPETLTLWCAHLVAMLGDRPRKLVYEQGYQLR